VDTLRSLPEREFISGVAEIIKYGIIWDRDFFEFIKTNNENILKKDENILTAIIKRSCEIKAEVVSKDERESSLRAILNYGHTVGHAIETLIGYGSYLHGEAISIGMIYEARLSNLLGFLSKENYQSIKDTIKNFGLPVDMPSIVDISAMIKTILIDKRTLKEKFEWLFQKILEK